MEVGSAAGVWVHDQTSPSVPMIEPETPGFNLPGTQSPPAPHLPDALAVGETVIVLPATPVLYPGPQLPAGPVADDAATGAAGPQLPAEPVAVDAAT